VLYALLFGSVLPIAVKMNEVLGRSIGAVPASVSVHATGALFGALCVLPFLERSWVAGIAVAPWWSFLGGVFGSMLVVLANRAIGALGVAAFTAVTVAAQLVISGVMDHFGLLGSPLHAMSAGRAVGIGFLALGAVLVVRS
jgi:transporter family-2 protein